MTTTCDRRVPADRSDHRLGITVTGVVQGVGFRPFVHRLATELGLSGYVGNDARSVIIQVQGPAGSLDEFRRRLAADAPPLSVIVGVDVQPLPPAGGADPDFTIVPSENRPGARTLVSPDVATCDDCLAELFDPADRRYRHPFITCTNCGPRFTIIRDLPYDRPATTMAGFPMCPRCASEYADPADRRFHAQPIACPDCGPVLWFQSGPDRTTGTDAALAAAQRTLAAGGVVAIKGVGGYHLACRADHPGALARLRERKARDQKPFALMARDLPTVGTLVELDDQERAVLTSPARPIVLMHRRVDAPVAAAVAPGSPLLAVMLPYTPVHHLLLGPVPAASIPAPTVLVMTSANLSDEPLCFDDEDAADRLPALADAVLAHDRPIHVPCDDSVVRVIDGQVLPIRRSRGYAPLPVRLPRSLPPTFAVGGELKNTCCLIDDENAFCSAHIGDMGSLATTRAFARAAGQLTALHQVSPVVVAADAHPGYRTRTWAENHAGAPGEPELRLVQHHHAHVVSLLAEHGRIGQPILGVAFDGTGYGDDGSVWGGELLLLGTDSSRYTRVGHLMPVDLPGGDAAVRNPCRMALAYLAASDLPWDIDLAPVAACTPEERAVVRAQLSTRMGTVASSSMGRLFDAVAALLGVRQRIGYEAQAAIELEVLAESGRTGCGGVAVPLAFTLDADGVLDHRPVIQAVVTGLRSRVPPAVLAYQFHRAVATAVATAAAQITARTSIGAIGLTGGVFQNALLLRETRRCLVDDGWDVLTHRVVPPNDGGLALGQAIVAALAREQAAPAAPDAAPDHQIPQVHR